MSRVLRAASAGLVLGLGLVVPPTAIATASADPIGNCTTTTGTIIAVDFSHWGGPVVRGCGVNDPSGYALLHAAGFSTAGDNHDGPAFICRIGNQAFRSGTQYPTAAQDPCILTPPAAAYWSYWVAPAGQNRWTYSQVGSTGTVPKPGEVELWTFGGTDLGGSSGSGVPSFSPDTIRAHNLTPTGTGANPGPTPTQPGAAPVTNASAPSASGPAATNASTPAPGGPGPSAVGHTSGNDPTSVSGATGAGGSKITTTSTPTTAKHGATGSDASGAIGGTASGAADTPRVVSAMPAPVAHHSSGSIAPLLVGIGLVAVLAAGTGWSMVRRRRRLQ